MMGRDGERGRRERQRGLRGGERGSGPPRDIAVPLSQCVSQFSIVANGVVELGREPSHLLGGGRRV